MQNLETKTGSNIFQENEPNPFSISEEILDIISKKFASTYNVLPVSKNDNSITLYYSRTSLQKKAQILLKKEFNAKKLEWVSFDEKTLKLLIQYHYSGRIPSKPTQINQSSQTGFSLIELLITTILALIVLATIAMRFKGSYLNIAPESVIADISTQLCLARQEALTGNSDNTKRTFSISKSLVKPHNGIIVTNTPIGFANTSCQGSCSDGQSSICVSGQSFCFTNEDSFTFDTFSGKTTNPHVIFINSTDRKLAFLITENGEFYLAELINGVWSSRRDLQNLVNNNNNTKG